MGAMMGRMSFHGGTANQNSRQFEGDVHDKNQDLDKQVQNGHNQAEHRGASSVGPVADRITESQTVQTRRNQ
jgi:hypothetical protein